MSPTTFPFDVWSAIIKRLSQEEILAFAGTCQGFLKIANRFWILQAGAYGIKSENFVSTAKCLTVTKSIFDNQLAFSKMPWFLDAFKAWNKIGSDVIIESGRAFYDGQEPYAVTHNDLLRYSSVPRSIDELFRLFAAAKQARLV